MVLQMITMVLSVKTTQHVDNSKCAKKMRRRSIEFKSDAHLIQTCIRLFEDRVDRLQNYTYQTIKNSEAASYRKAYSVRLTCTYLVDSCNLRYLELKYDTANQQILPIPNRLG